MNETTSATKIEDGAANKVNESSRRALLRAVALGVGAAGVTTLVAEGRPALAADGDAVTMGQTNEFNTATNVNYKGATTAASFNVQSGDETAGNNTILNNNFNSAGAALLGVASGNGNQAIGIIGWSKKPNGTGVIGFTGGAGAYGGEFFGGLAELRLRPGGAAPITLANAHQVGEMYEDQDGTLWICTTAGTPGTWREIAGSTTAGAFHAIEPRRIYDSRPGNKLAPGDDRVISVANATDGTPDVVPAKATAVALTVTITETEGTGGFVAVRPAGTAYHGTSSINWFGPGQSLATTVITGVDSDRQITLRAGSQPTQIIVDVTGYYR
ncbi:MAG TPA: hypothetical protein VLD86_06880 [Ilumatobacteraceae bacterium]|nr:hypothetical protein [Ilumatobacteraceae bacterium]